MGAQTLCLHSCVACGTIASVVQCSLKTEYVDCAGDKGMPQNKYNIPDQVTSYEDLQEKFSEQEITDMCNAYLKTRVRSKYTRAGQQAELKEFRAAKKAGLIASNGAKS